MFVLHKCDVRLCINPDHLELGDHLTNMAQMVARGRHALKNKTHCSKGHLYEIYGYHNKHGYRVCRICMKAHNARRAGQPRIEKIVCELRKFRTLTMSERVMILDDARPSRAVAAELCVDSAAIRRYRRNHGAGASDDFPETPAFLKRAPSNKAEAAE
jgi:hypothetical protein